MVSQAHVFKVVVQSCSGAHKRMIINNAYTYRNTPQIIKGIILIIKIIIVIIEIIITSIVHLFNKDKRNQEPKICGHFLYLYL